MFILANGYYRTTYPDGETLIQMIHDNKNEVGDSLEKEVRMGAKFERVIVLTQEEFDNKITMATGIGFQQGFAAGMEEK